MDRGVGVTGAVGGVESLGDIRSVHLAKEVHALTLAQLVLAFCDSLEEVLSVCAVRDWDCLGT